MNKKYGIFVLREYYLLDVEEIDMQEEIAVEALDEKDILVHTNLQADTLEEAEELLKEHAVPYHQYSILPIYT